MGEDTTNPPRVLIGCDYLWCGGAEGVTVTLANLFRRLGFPVHVHCLLSPSGVLRGRVDDGIQITGSEILPASAQQLIDVAREQRPVLAVVNHSYPTLVVLRPVRDRIGRVVVIVHAPVDKYLPFVAPDAQEIVDLYVGVSEEICRWLADRGVPEGKVLHLPNLVDEEAFAPAPVDRAALLSALGEKVLPDEILLGYVGRVAPEKCVSIIVKAYMRLRASGLPVRLAIVGGEDLNATGQGLDGYREWIGPEIEAVERLCVRCDEEEIPRPIWTYRAVEDPIPWYRAIDVLVLASRYEGHPLVALEAMACGTPVVVPDVGGCPSLVEMVGANGGSAQTGVVYPHRRPGLPPDLDDLVSALRSFVERDARLRQRMGAAARRFVVSNHSVSAIGGRYARELLGLPDPAPIEIPIVKVADDGGLTRVEKRGTSPVNRSARARAAVRAMRPRVIVVYDADGWSFHRIAGQIQRHLADEFDVDARAYWPPPYGGLDYDAVVLLFYGAIWDSPHPSDPPSIPSQLPGIPVVTCVYDQNLWRTKQPFRGWMRDAVERSAALMAASPHLEAILSDAFPDVAVLSCYDGVDVDAFPVQPWTPTWGRLRVGWCGNADEEHHGTTKGLGLIRRACDELPFAELVLAERTASPIRHEDMAAWYRDVDVYACMSRYEGTPNPILEASACGRPWISTDVGIVRSLLESAPYGTPPGVIVERGWRRLRDELARMYLELGAGGIAEMSRSARAAVENGWSWRTRAEQFRVAIRRAIG